MFGRISRIYKGVALDLWRIVGCGTILQVDNRLGPQRRCVLWDFLIHGIAHGKKKIYKKEKSWECSCLSVPLLLIPATKSILQDLASFVDCECKGIAPSKDTIWRFIDFYSFLDCLSRLILS